MNPGPGESPVHPGVGVPVQPVEQVFLQPNHYKQQTEQGTHKHCQARGDLGGQAK